MWPKACIHKRKEVADEEAKGKTVVEFDGEARSGKENRIGNRPDRKSI